MKEGFRAHVQLASSSRIAPAKDGDRRSCNSSAITDTPEPHSPRIEAAHMPIGFGITIKHALLLHLPPRLRRLVLIYPTRVAPMLFRHFPKVNLASRHSPDAVFELLREVFFIQKNPWIFSFLVETVFYLSHAAHHPF